MSSQLNVDTIVDKAGSGGTNVKIANTSVTVSEGGSATTNTVQGLVKAWIQHNAGTSINDSFNFGSVTDVGTGNYKPNYTNNMANDDYAASGMCGNANDRYCAAGSMTTALVDTHYKRGDANTTDISEALLIVIGDLA